MMAYDPGTFTEPEMATAELSEKTRINVTIGSLWAILVVCVGGSVFYLRGNAALLEEMRTGREELLGQISQVTLIVTRNSGRLDAIESWQTNEAYTLTTASEAALRQFIVDPSGPVIDPRTMQPIQRFTIGPP